MFTAAARGSYSVDELALKSPDNRLVDVSSGIPQRQNTIHQY